MSFNLPNVRDIIFKQVHTNNLVYNTCWEDPRCDRHLLKLKSDSSLIMITSAGCNALDYLLDNPQVIHAIDMNPRQNALLELKVAIFQHGDYEHLFKFFGEGAFEGAAAYYQKNLRAHLSDFSKKYWDKNIAYFNGKGLKKSFYFNGTSGLLAGMLMAYIKTKPKLFKLVNALFEAETLDEQKKVYKQMEPLLFNEPVKWLLNRHITISLAGVPRPQRQLIMETYEKEGVAGYVKDSLRHIFCNISVKNNYFWYVYVFGSYTKDCCPEYLKEENFEKIKANSDRIKLHTTTISQFLKDHPDNYSHYILLDHQDWLAAHDVVALNEEWELILKNSKKDTRILQRSAANKIDFFPEFIMPKIDFEEEITASWHLNDRVGTYGSVYLGMVK
ncbi:DUF3419 family protein [Chondrinema litorale]|uniref:DUF3419 family protein n=1 Tax=Chondrinema litorale TaxID=2994555 RepID=UPI002543BD50|nr:BtaA family protein [Chondrinema litorale]UZR99245.1 BtaA family protein [Chondrinema litorale]